MPGCAKIIYNDITSIITAGGQDSSNDPLKSIEVLNIDTNTLAPISEWILLESELNFARKHFPSIGVIGSALFVTGGTFSSKNASHSVEKFENGHWIVTDELQLATPRSGHSTISVSQEWCNN